MTIDLTKTGIDPFDLIYKQMLNQLQGNILKPHGRDYSSHIILRFTAEARATKEWIQNFARAQLSSALQQVEEAKSFRETQQPGQMFVSIFLSASGYEHLGFDPGKFDEENDTFRLGMKKRRRVNTFFPNKDPRVEQWEEVYRGSIHALIMLADDSAEAVRAATESIAASVSTVAQILAIERGYVLRNSEKEPIEHFGYVDGLSNPRFLKGDLELEERQTWDPSAPLGQVLAPDPFNTAPDAFGSYFVFRKLEQNVHGFNLGIRELSARLRVDEALAGAMVVGRFRDGTPLTLEPQAGLGAVNDFNYRNDKDALKCPFHAHIRKANQRGETPLTSEESERSRRIARRGVVYGERAPGLTDEPEGGVGLLFMCYQADIGHQFEFLQRVWFDNPRFPEILSETGDCPLIGQDGDEPQRWRTKWGDEGGDEDAERLRINFGDWIRLKGGEYFFAPSVGFLQNIVADLP
ncbi:MAG: Dyp-type peroxidase [Acidobacteria bacterium]|nr:Dyp-type peroxidase [Acidobacteriota bacterium]